MMEKEYVEKRDQGYRVAGSRISLDSLVFTFLEGLSPEAIAAECFPTLTLEQVYGAIAYYLAHRAEVDAHLRQADTEFDALRQQTHKTDPAFAAKLAQARHQTPTFGS